MDSERKVKILPNRIISVIILLFYITAVTPSAFASIMDKIRGYSIKLPGQDKPLNVINRDLWFSSTSKEIEDYAAAIKDSPYNPISSNAVTVYASIGADDQTLTLNNGKVIDLINSAPEYYFTDMVFIQQKYEEALVDLYYYRAEASGSSRSVENRAIMDEAIAGTYWVAAQNGVTLTEEQIQAKFLEKLDKQLSEGKTYFANSIAGLEDNPDELSKPVIKALREYYINPNMDTFDDVCQKIIDQNKKANVFTIFISMITRIASGLGLAIANHTQDKLLATNTLCPSSLQ